MPGEAHGRTITLEQMLSLRISTEAVSSWLRADLEDRLETLRPLLAPRKFLGDHMKSAFREEVKDADRVFEQVQSLYREAAADLKLPGRLDSPIEAVSNKIEVHPWEYAHDAATGAETKRVTIKSPTSWVIVHACNLGFGQARQALAPGAPRPEADLKQFALHAVLTKVILDRSAAVVRLLEAMRYRVEVSSCPEMGRLPLVRLVSCVPAFRPADSVILSAVRLSGVAIFEELVDMEAAATMEDPIRERLTGIAGGTSS